MLPDVREYCSRCLASQTSYKPPFNPPGRSLQLYYSIEQGHFGIKRLSAQPQDTALQHVKRRIDSVHGLGLGDCLACSQ